MASIKSSVNNGSANRRVPNAFMLFVKEKSQDLLKKCSDEEKASMGTYLGKKWRSMSVEEKQVYFEKYKALKALEVDELDPDPNTADTSSDEVNTKLKNSLTHSSAKQKSSKKVRRPPNAFMIFARENRHTLDPSLKKDKKVHTSTILGNVWRELEESQKAKYIAEARRLLNLHKMSEPASYHKILKKKNKVRSEIAPKKPVGRRRKKESRRSSTSNMRNQEAYDDVKNEIESNSNKPSENVENAGTKNTSSEHHTYSNYPNLSRLHEYNGAMGNPPQMPSSVEHHHSNPCCACCNSGASSYQNLNSEISGVSGSCFGAASSPPLFSSYPFNASSWMPHQLYPYFSAGFYPPPYGYHLPYSYNNAYNGYVNYKAQYSRRVVESSSYAAPNSNAPATATSASTGEESEEEEKTDENSNDEQLVVDEDDVSEKEPQEDGTN